MLDVQAAPRFMFKRFGRFPAVWQKAVRMAETDGQDEALARLESALDRIARHAADAAEPAFDPAPAAARLDRLIAALRTELATLGAEG